VREGELKKKERRREMKDNQTGMRWKNDGGTGGKNAGWHASKCPVCSVRLFDIEEYLIGQMRIKCPHCKATIELYLTSERVISAVRMCHQHS
jgi:phage FluMu protein Com